MTTTCAGPSIGSIAGRATRYHHLPQRRLLISRYSQQPHKWISFLSGKNMPPNIEAFFDPATGTVSYVVFDEPGGSCAIIDPVLDYDARSGRTRTFSADKLIGFIRGQRLKVEWILDTHVHADHLTSAHYLRSTLGGRTAISRDVPLVQRIFKEMFHLGPEFIPDGSHFDYLLADEEAFKVGKLEAKAISTSGHTPADMAYQFGEALFVGDTLFMPDLGTARADFPGGDARRLFRSIRKILDQPVQTRLFMCHDYPPHTREARWETTVAEQRVRNIHVRNGISEDDFVAMREARDATLDMPMLLLPSVQVNVRAGRMPPPEENGTCYLKIPLNVI
jgi:glyoxylase-like metal-dependent hydrolase (beta-lactamase superfamily II)